MTVYKNAQEPIYKQIKLNVLSAIAEGVYKEGDKLPTEREMAQMLHISRGTVKKAYESLEQEGVVRIIWGSGVFVGNKENQKPEKDSEFHYMPDTVKKLYKKQYSLQEAHAFIEIQTQLALYPKRVHIAAIDCNIETLDIIKSQLGQKDQLNYMAFLLSDVQKFIHGNQIFSHFDLIFTTTTHYEMLLNHMADYKEKIVKAVVAPDRTTIINLVKISNEDKIGMLVKSRRFKDIVKRNIEPYGLTVFDQDCIFEQGLNEELFTAFLDNKDALIMPPLHALSLPAEVYDRIFEFNSSGGKIITFNYSIEKGSLIYIEEKILSIKEQF